MPQSYKTNRRVSGVPGRWFRVAACLLLFTLSAYNSQAAKPKKALPGYQVFTSYEYRFRLPQPEAAAAWEKIRLRYSAPNLPSGFTSDVKEQNIIDLYFDDEKQALLEQELMLRHRLFISGEGRKERLQFLVPEAERTTQTFIFRQNRKPDKGANFTDHPLLKLLRAKDRPALDSLLRKCDISAQNLQPVLEVTHREKRLYLRRQGNEWVSIALAQYSTEAPEHHFAELQIRVNQQPANKAQMQGQKFTVDTLAASLQKLFNLQPETSTEYAALTKNREQESPSFTRTKALAGTTLLVGMAAYFIFRKLRKKKEKH
ncbi:hypothetical protein [Adhaeribacter soli]|uniref:CYTH domain-containing protein n=1 Tax=Adhaeribacter soli TaxID=2607655 RepID=A0A5N1IPR7_9BACT|nr:hypothetical protein [Adhaeribacter soli]KAA9331951.1 hypothetical protein F0P94_14245 [Adhaeribacter soli]